MLLVAALAFGCGPPVVDLSVKLITTTCTSPDPVEGVTHFEFRVKGDDMAPLRLIAPALAHALQIPRIPAGLNRVVEIRGYAGEPRASGRLLSLGRSLPFNIPVVQPLPGRGLPEVVVFLRRINTFTPPSLSVGPSACTRMGVPRAGHSATVLEDGRVLIAGGYQVNALGERTSLGSAEIYDPNTGAFSVAADLAVFNAHNDIVTAPRAFHTGTLLPSGSVLLAGGEVSAGGTITPAPTALLYDPVFRRYGSVLLPEPRSRHAAVADASGRVLILGGITTGGAWATPLVWFDPATAQFSVVPGESLARREVAAGLAQDGRTIAVAGGTDGSAVSNEIRFYSFNGSTFVAAPVARLREGRRGAALAPFQQSQMVVVGGYSTPDDMTGVDAMATTELVDVGGAMTVSDGPAVSPRGDVCATALPDGRVLTIGGRAGDFGVPRSDPSAEMITKVSTGAVTSLGMPPLAVPRYHHTCTLLPDGTVLVLGGLRDEFGPLEALRDAWIFTPVPLD